MSLNHIPSLSHVFQGQHFLNNSFVSRKLLQQIQQQPHVHDKNSLSSNVLMLLSILVCGIICSLGLHYVIRCAFKRSTRFMISDPISIPNKGIKKKALEMFPVVNYSPEMNLSGLGEECVICLSHFAAGEKLRLLPKCNHGFHVRCIDKWLTQHPTCPKCRHCLVETCQKILGDCIESDQVVAATPETTTTTESIDVRIAPLEPESRVDTFRGRS